MRAVKIITKHSNSPKPIDFKRELEAIAKFSQDRYNSWFVKSFGWYEDTDSIFIAMEYCEHGDLDHYLSNTHSLDIAEPQQLIYQILEGLNQMHSNDFAHRDLKPGNILIKSKPPADWWVVLSDFGITKRAQDNNGPSTVKGTQAFMAPELLGFIDHPSPVAPDFKAADMWALGEISFRIVTGEATFRNPRELMAYCLGTGRYPSDRLISCAGNHGNKFISKLMTVSPGDRMNTTEALDHPWMDSQRMNIERDFVGMNLEDVDGPPRVIPIEVNLDASKSWSALSDTGAIKPTVKLRGEESSPTLKFSLRQTLSVHLRPVEALAFSPDGSQLVSGSIDDIWRWDIRSGDELLSVPPDLGRIGALAFTPDGAMLVASSSNLTVSLWNNRSRAMPQKLTGSFIGIPRLLALSLDGRLLALSSSDQTIRLWNYSSRALLQTFVDPLGSVALSPDGRLLAWPSGEYTIRLWDIRSRKMLAELMDHSKHATLLAFSTDGVLLASASFEGTVRLWDLRSRAVLQTLVAPPQAVTALAFSPDSRLLASAADQTITLWDTRSGTVLQTLAAQTSKVKVLAFSPDGMLLASTAGTTINLWDGLETTR